MKKVAIISLALLLGVSVGMSFAAECMLFGPNTYERTKGKPNLYTATFPGVEGEGRLIVTNGEEDGSYRISSALISINGEQIFGPSDFNQQVYILETPINLGENNSISVELRSNPGSYLTIEVKQEVGPGEAVIGPKGGIFEFPNGVILDIPPGAITETTLIEVTDLPLDQVNAILSMPGYSTHVLRCIARFSAEPTGLVFQSPITAIVPVLELGLGEIPVQIEVDLIGEKYSIAPTDLVYRGEQSVVEMSILHFSETDLAGIQKLEQAVDNVCKTCLFYGDEQVRELCEYWAGYEGQPWCCYIPRAERQACAPNCECCKEKEIVVKSGEIDFATGQCQLLNAELEVTFPQCPGIPPFKEDYGETSIECPENMEVVIFPSNPSIYICEEITLEAKLTSKDDEGNVVLSETIPAKEWRLLPQDTDVAEISEVPPTTAVVLGLQEGTVQVYAQSPDPRFKGQTTLTVQKPELEIISGDGDFLMDVGDEETWDALCVNCPDGEVVWGTNRPDVVELTELAGNAVRVKAISKGAAEIRAYFICGVPQPVEYVATLVVEQEVASVEIDPNTATIYVGQTLPLTVTVKDRYGNPLPGGCPGPISWTIPPGKIIGFDPINQIVTGESKGKGTIIATCEGVSGESTITVVIPSGTYTGHVVLSGYWITACVYHVTFDLAVNVEIEGDAGSMGLSGTISSVFISGPEYCTGGSWTLPWSWSLDVFVSDSHVYGQSLGGWCMNFEGLVTGESLVGTLEIFSLGGEFYGIAPVSLTRQ